MPTSGHGYKGVFDTRLDNQNTFTETILLANSLTWNIYVLYIAVSTVAVAFFNTKIYLKMFHLRI